MRLFTPLYPLFILAAVVLLGVSFAVPNLPADIHVQDTYFVFDLPTLLRAFAFGLLLLWMLYLVNKPFLYSRQLTRAHVVVTLVSTVTALGTVLRVNSLRKELTPMRQDLWTAYYRWEQVVNIALVLLLAAQVIFLLHLAKGLKKTFLKR